MKVAATGRKAVMAGIAIATAAVTVVTAIATAAATSTRRRPHRATDVVTDGRMDNAAVSATASVTSASIASIRTSHVLRLSNSRRSSSRQLPSLKQHRRNLQKPLATSARIAQTAAIVASAADVADVVGAEVEVEIAKVRPTGAPATPSHARRARATINTAWICPHPARNKPLNRRRLGRNAARLLPLRDTAIRNRSRCGRAARLRAAARGAPAARAARNRGPG